MNTGRHRATRRIGRQAEKPSLNFITAVGAFEYHLAYFSTE